jgi:hypothetical protein
MKKNKLPSLISILILTLITSVFWVSLSTYRAFTAKPSESVPKEISDPINLSLDQTAIQKIESGIYFDSSQIPDNIGALPTSVPFAQPTLQPQPIPTTEVISTPIPSPSP